MVRYVWLSIKVAGQLFLPIAEPLGIWSESGVRIQCARKTGIATRVRSERVLECLGESPARLISRIPNRHAPAEPRPHRSVWLTG